MQSGELLRRAGLRVTRQRLVVLGLLMEKDSPMSHAEITAALADPLDKVTLYRTLQTLGEADIVHQVQGPDGVWRFCAHSPDAEGCGGGHAHFLCLSCGKMSCLVDQRLPRVEVPEGIEVEGKQLVVYGRCPECAREK